VNFPSPHAISPLDSYTRCGLGVHGSFGDIHDRQPNFPFGYLSFSFRKFWRNNDRMRKLFSFCLLASSSLGQVFNPVDKERTPEAVQQLPREVRLDLVKRQCLIPKYKGAAENEDAAYTMSHFRSRTSVDYAVVCHTPSLKTQNVLVYSRSKGAWKGEIIFRGGFDPAPQADKCEVAVGIATPKDIVVHAQAYAPEELKSLPSLDHNGVDVGICEKASIILYFSKGKWQGLQGAD
jgi:hypothetical protein